MTEGGQGGPQTLEESPGLVALGRGLKGQLPVSLG